MAALQASPKRRPPHCVQLRQAQCANPSDTKRGLSDLPYVDSLYWLPLSSVARDLLCRCCASSLVKHVRALGFFFVSLFGRSQPAACPRSAVRTHTVCSRNASTAACHAPGIGWAASAAHAPTYIETYSCVPMVCNVHVFHIIACMFPIITAG